MKRHAALENFLVAMAATLTSLHQTHGTRDVHKNSLAFVATTRPAYLKLSNSIKYPRRFANCEANAVRSESASLFPVATENYIKLNPDHVERTSLQDTHALFGTLFGDGFIERYDVYRRIPTITNNEKPNSNNQEIVAVDLQIGHRLNGHDKIVHGGIISLLIDEAMGWAAYISLEHHTNNIDGQFTSDNTILVTANLNIDFRAPFVAGSEAVLRVILDRENTGGRKMYFVARLESYDGVVFAEARSLFLCVGKEKMSGVIGSN